MQFPKRINWFLLVIPILIFALGFVTLFSTQPDLARNQLVFFAISIVVYLGVALVDYRVWGHFWKPMYFVTLGLLVLTFVLGQELFGSTRWLQIGSFNLQPSEFTKIVVIMVVAFLLSKKSDSIENPKYLLNIMLYIVPLFGLVFIQPDLGTSIVIISIVLAILWFGGLKKIYFVVSLLLVGVFSTPLWSLLKDYQRERILVFLNPSLDILGSGYNVIQSSIAIGSGGLFGRGFGRGTQSHLQFLPVFWTDFVFAAFAEEWGFVGVMLLLSLFTILFFIILTISVKTKDSFGSLISIGVFTVFFLQFIVNVGMNLGIMPVTGIPLPLVSYGGSSLLTSAFLLGLVQSVWIHEKV
ncbi:rod shape-determining protein RodA [candidate division WWE3 bacterium]|jgi:rod shape determining protein RodA|nr:rod shape-determining protein RodA [candidate division WWE3 bacterium]MBT7349409.1 rod shape-determining protein RodA [candidate division WWE3 bacterium]